MWSNAGSRMFPRFFPHLTISLSQALGQRTAKRLKVLPAFSKAAGCRAEPYGLPGVRGVLVPGGHRSGQVYVATSVGAGRLPLADSTRGGSRDPQPLPSHTPKKGGRMSPSWGASAPGGFACGRGGQGASATAPAATAFGVCAACAAFFPPAAPVKAVERCSTPRKPLKRLERNFYAASRGDSLKNCLYQIKKAYTVHTRRLLSALPFLWSSSSFISFSVWKNFWAFSPKNSSLTML